MAISVAKNTIIENIWKIFYDRVKADVSTVSITGPHNITIQNYVAAYSDKMLSEKSNYPILVVDSPSISSDYFTGSKDKFEGTIDVEIYTNQSEAADKFLSAIMDSIETYRNDMRKSGISMVDLDSTENDMVERGRLKIHMRRARFSFEYHYTKT